jgi:hypothetical protein
MGHLKFFLIFLQLNIACIANVWRDNIYAMQIYATAAWLA